MSHVGAEPAAIWMCPGCGKTWVSAIRRAGYDQSAWRCARCGYDTAVVARERQLRLDKERRLKVKRERGQIAPDDPRHGTRNAYCYLKCRCPRCRAANSAYARSAK